MPPKKKKAATKSASGDKKKARPTRCGPEFQWEPITPLVDAINKNNIEQVERLLLRGADPNEGLHHAIGRGKVQVAELLLRAGANVHTSIQPSDYYVPPLEDPSTKKAASGDKKKAKKGKGKKKKKT
eukprot:m.17713 g.17713  ORF g.17713 m.17713 type:complete len:127 (-) comp4824_c0_seq1:326-706(-)